MESVNPSSPVQIYRTGIFLFGGTVEVETFIVFCSMAFFNAHLLQTPLSELWPLHQHNRTNICIPALSLPIIWYTVHTFVIFVMETWIKRLFHYNMFSINNADAIREVILSVEFLSNFQHLPVFLGLFP